MQTLNKDQTVTNNEKKSNSTDSGLGITFGSLFNSIKGNTNKEKENFVKEKILESIQKNKK